jgi:photosystem II stability/assembly factor-like uncharacterized protein
MKLLIASFIALVLMLGSVVAQDQVTVDSRTFGAITARHIGPAVMSGRVAAIAASNADPRIIYIGAATGGVWKSTNGGVSFKPVFDKYTQAIGGIAIDQARPDTVWVGTGEPWVRNSVSVGTGMYRTTDAGENWKCMGLPNSERINKILIDPVDPRIVTVAVVGKLWSDSEERGVYRTMDGGETWDRILYVNPRTGCADLAMDPSDRNILYAAMWEIRREPHRFVSGGPGSGLHKSTDGGRTWTKLTTDLPAGTLGRIALAVAPSKSGMLYAVIEAEKGGCFRSTDYGISWSKMGSDLTILQRPFYFSLLAVDPQDPNRIYKPGFYLSVSADSGTSWSSYGGSMHPDMHAIWIDPSNPSHILIGTDGGAYESVDRGGTWRMFQNLPLSQFYHVAYDMERPYNVYGGLQDNGSWKGPSQSPGGIENRDWENLGGGDGFNAFPDPVDNTIQYWQYQGGNIMRKHSSTLETKEIKPYRLKGEGELRWNWNTPMVFGPKSKALYAGAQYLFRSTNRGDSWQRISPDLTTNDTAKQNQKESGGLTLDNSTAENHCTIFSISESPKDASIVWAGTDDGNLQVTRNGGKSWKNVVGNVPGLPAGTWCMSISAGNQNAGTAYAAFSGHQTGDLKVYLYRTSDFGEHWTPLASDSIKGFARVLREDPVNPDLLFAGTEAGLYVSVDAGKQWARFTGDFPPVPVYDVAIHPREGDLIVATHGRGVLIIDDISPLRSMTMNALTSDIHIFPSRPLQLRIPKYDQSFPGDAEFVGDNPSESATITYYLKKRPVIGDLNIKIYSPEGKLLKLMPAGKYKGLNRVRWAMRMKPPKVPPSPTLAGQALFGPMVPAGKYTFEIVRPDTVVKGSFTLIPDASVPYTTAEREKQYSTVMNLYSMQSDLSYVADAVSQLRDDALQRKSRLEAGDPVAASLQELSTRLDSLHSSLLVEYMGSGLTAEQRLRENVVELYGAVSNYGGAPTQSQLDEMKVLQSEIGAAASKFQKIHSISLPSINELLSGKHLEPLKLMSRSEFDAKEGDAAGSKPLLRSLRLFNCMRVW